MRKFTVNIFRIIAVCVVGAGLSPAQTTARPPHGLVTLKLTWSRELSTKRDYRAPRDESAGPPRRDNPYDNPVDKLRTPSPIPNSPPPDQRTPHYRYTYSLKVSNEGGKRVRGVFWEYVATAQDSGAELSRRQFINIQGIAPGRVATLRAEAPSPPTNLVTAGGLGQDARSPFKSSAEIKCVLYADATVWGADGSEKACDELRQAEARARKGKRP